MVPGPERKGRGKATIVAAMTAISGQVAGWARAPANASATPASQRTTIPAATSRGTRTTWSASSATSGTWVPRSPPSGRCSAGSVARRCSPNAARRPDRATAAVAWPSPDALIQGGALTSSSGTTAIHSRRRLWVRIARNAPDATTAGAVMRWVHSARPAAMPQPTSRTTDGRPRSPPRMPRVKTTAESSRAAGYMGGGSAAISSR